MTSVSGQAADVSVMSSVTVLSSWTWCAVDQAEVDDVDAELGVDDVLHRLGRRPSSEARGRGVVGRGRASRASALRSRRSRSAPRSCCSSSRLLATACAVASFHAIQPSSAHFTRAGYATPGEGDAVLEHVLVGLELAPALHERRGTPRDVRSASSTCLPMTRSVMTDVLAWLIEQPCPSYDTS